jgi:hypothetical protein
MLKVLWTSRNLKKPSAREQRALDFIAIIQKPIRGLRISLLAREFSKIPELNVFNQKFPDLSREARKVFEKVYKLNAKDPEIGMRIITILACNVECAFYTPKLKEVVFQTLNEWLLSDDLPRRKELNGVFFAGGIGLYGSLTTIKMCLSNQWLNYS